jgi:nicotinate phosphoribosyltransferase
MTPTQTLPATPDPSPLLTDLYQLAMMQAYVEAGRTETAVFEFFVRRLPPERRFLVAAGLAQVVEWLRALRFGEAECAWLRASDLVSPALVDRLAGLRFAGDVDAMPEGRVFFADEPILRVSAPLPIAQFVETRLINLLHVQTVIASKAAHLRLAAPTRMLIDYGLRRAHGAEAGLFAARAAWIAGFDGTATLRAAAAWGIPAQGTMAHAFVQAFDDESEAFAAFAAARPKDLVLLIDTYDCARAATRIVALLPRFAAAGIRIAGVRIDSGDLVAEARRVRAILDAGGLAHVRIIASGGIDEADLVAHARADAPIDGYGIGTCLATASDAPALDCAYKLQDYAGVARRKRSAGKTTWPGRKQVWRRYAADGTIAGDTLSLETDPQPGEALLVPVMRGGAVVDADLLDLGAARQLCRDDLARLPEALRAPTQCGFAPEIAPALRRLASEIDRRVAGGAA